MRIIVIGAGAMGSIYGGHLSLHNEVRLVDTNESLIERVRENGITLEENGIENKFFPSISTGAEDFGKADLVILFTKAMYSAAAIENVMCAVGEGTYLMTLQNGAGHEAVLSRFVDKSHVIIGTTEDNGSLLSTGVIHHGGKGVTNIGLASGNDTNVLCRIKEVFDSCGFSVRIHENIQQLIWDKLMTNVSLSVLTAILQSDMSFISRDKSAFEICKKLIGETVTVAKAMGLSFDLPSVIEKVRSTSENNPGGYTSIMMDIKNGRKSEVDTISGAVVRKAHELGIPVPHHEMAVSLIHALENVRRG